MNFHSKPTTFVSKVNLKVENIERSIQFYSEIIGFDILDQTSSSANLTTDGSSSILTIEQPENVIPKNGRTTGLYHFALLLPEKKDLADFVVHLTDKGIRFGASDHLVSEALYLNDPDGNQIEVYIDQDPSEWNWNGDEVSMAVDPLNFEKLLKNTLPNSSWQGLPQDTLMGHIHLHVSELVKTEEFYVEGLGFDIVNRFGDQALFLSTGNYHHHIGVNTWNGKGVPAPPENSVGLRYFSLNFSNKEVLDGIISNLNKIGAKVVESNNKIVTYDPSGNVIELTI